VTLKRETDCFADEVAIDFPSVAHLVARVRRSFLADCSGERAETVRTEVCLSSGEASRGAVVSVMVLLRATCPDCGGRGETWAEPCRACDGNGHSMVPRRLRVTIPPRINDGSKFHFRLHTPHEASVHVEVRVAITES
jgi:DnaJ-class molecular chaperone